MNKLRFATLGLAMVVAAGPSANAQIQYIGYVYPAGGQQGTTFPIRLGGQRLQYASGLIVSEEGVSVRLVDCYRGVDNQAAALLQKQLKELQKEETVLSDAMVARMAWFEFPAPIGPAAGPEAAGLICPICGTVNLLDAKSCVKCYAKLEKPKAPKLAAKIPVSRPQVRKGIGQAEADRADPAGIRGKPEQPGRSLANRARLCRGHGGAGCNAGPARDQGYHPKRRLQPAALLRGPDTRSRTQADENLPAPRARQRAPGPAQKAAGRRGDAHQGAVYDERPGCPGRGQPVPFPGEQGATAGHLRQGPRPDTLCRRRRARLVPGRDEGPRRSRQGVGVQRRFSLKP